MKVWNTVYPVALRRSRKYGRTVVATYNIKKGRLLLVEPVLIIPNDSCVGIVSEYAYRWDKRRSALVLGLGSLFNHSYDPNAEYEFDMTRNVARYTAIKDILYGQEVLINYNGDSRSKAPVWFEVK